MFAAVFEAALPLPRPPLPLPWPLPLPRPSLLLLEDVPASPLAPVEYSFKGKITSFDNITTSYNLLYDKIKIGNDIIIMRMKDILSLTSSLFPVYSLA